MRTLLDDGSSLTGVSALMAKVVFPQALGMFCSCGRSDMEEGAATPPPASCKSFTTRGTSSREAAARMRWRSSSAACCESRTGARHLDELLIFMSARQPLPLLATTPKELNGFCCGAMSIDVRNQCNESMLEQHAYHHVYMNNYDFKHYH